MNNNISPPDPPPPETKTNISADWNNQLLWISIMAKHCTHEMAYVGQCNVANVYREQCRGRRDGFFDLVVDRELECC